MPNGQSDQSLFLAPPPEPEPAPEPPAGPAAPLHEVEGGRRRRLQVLVVVVLLIAGIVANRSTSGNQVAEEGAGRPGEGRDGAAGAPSRPVAVAPSLRTMERLGPLLPDPTGTTLVLAAGTQVIVLDVDTGTQRSVQVADLDVTSAYPWGSPVLAVRDAIVVRSKAPRAKLVPRADGGAVTDLDAGSGGGFYPSTSEGRYWVEELRGEGRLEELDLDGTVSRTVPVPNGEESIVWDGSGFVQTVDGTILAFPADGGEPMPLGEGLAVAADAMTVAVLRCPDVVQEQSPEAPPVACGLELLDRATGSSRPVPLPEDVVGFEAGYDSGVVPALSGDGRWLLLRSNPPARTTQVSAGAEPVTTGLAVVDVAAGTVRAVEPGSGSRPPVGAFSPDGRWLFLGSSIDSVTVELSAVRLADGDRFALDVPLSMRASFGLVLEGFPSVPADLGAGGS